MSMFADDTKIWNIVKSDSDCSDLQMDIDVLVQWSNKWLLHFNSDKCKVMSLGHSVRHDYSITDHSGTHSMSRTSEEKDLGIFITDNLKPSLQCTKAVARARSILGMVRRNFKRLDCEDCDNIQDILDRILNTLFRLGLHTSGKIYSASKVSNELQLDLYLASRNSPTRKDYAKWDSQHWR